MLPVKMVGPVLQRFTIERAIAESAGEAMEEMGEDTCEAIEDLGDEVEE